LMPFWVSLSLAAATRISFQCKRQHTWKCCKGTDVTPSGISFPGPSCIATEMVWHYLTGPDEELPAKCRQCSLVFYLTTYSNALWKLCNKNMAKDAPIVLFSSQLWSFPSVLWLSEVTKHTFPMLSILSWSLSS
jgi:hypothetical protein